MTVPLTIMGIMVGHRAEIAPEMQEVITKHGSDILSRMGIPSPSKDKGLITLILEAETELVHEFHKELEAIPGITVQTISFQQ